MAKSSEIIDLLTKNRLFWPHSKIEDATLFMYSKTLTDLSVMQIELAFRNLIKTSEYFPTIAAIYKEVESVQEFAEPQGKLTAGEAWEEILANAKNIGPYSSEPWKFSTPEVERALQLFGGKDCIYNLEQDAVNTARAQFRDVYNGLLAKKERQDRTQATFKAIGITREQLLAERLALNNAME